MFEQMVNDCAREASFRKLDNEDRAKSLLPWSSGSIWKIECCKGGKNMRNGIGYILFYAEGQ